MIIESKNGLVMKFPEGLLLKTGELKQQRCPRQKKTSLGNIRLCKRAYFANIASCSYSILLTRYVSKGLVGAPSVEVTIRNELLTFVLTCTIKP